MSFLQLDQISWQAREIPLSPVALFVSLPQLPLLAQKLNSRFSDEILPFRAVYSANGFILLGEQEQLPWVPEIRYLGLDNEAPHLLLPTNLSPSLPLALIDRAIFTQVPDSPAAIIPGKRLLFPLAQARSLDSKKLIALSEKVRCNYRDR